MTVHVFRSKFQPSLQIFTSLDNVDQDINKNDPIRIEQTTSNTLYIFPLTGEICDKESAGAADDDDEIDSIEEDCVTGEETEVHTTSTRVNAFPKIVFFGTGSSFTGVTKSATSILVQTS